MTPKQAAIVKKLGKVPSQKGSKYYEAYYEGETPPKDMRAKKEPKITKHEDRHHVIAENYAQKADPHYEMADRPHLTTGSKTYQETLAKSKALGTKLK